jgi:DNA polymerase V
VARKPIPLVPAPPLQPGSVADGWTFRQLARCGATWQLRPLNPAYPVTDLDDLATIRGVIIQKARPGRRRALKRYVD